MFKYSGLNYKSVRTFEWRVKNGEMLSLGLQQRKLFPMCSCLFVVVQAPCARQLGSSVSVSRLSSSVSKVSAEDTHVMVR